MNTMVPYGVVHWMGFVVYFSTSDMTNLISSMLLAAKSVASFDGGIK